MDKRLIVGALLCVSLLGGEPRFGFGLGQTVYDDVNFRFSSNNGFVEYTLNPYSRLQFGLKYAQTGALLDAERNFRTRGLLAALRLYLNTLAAKTPYFGYNLGWINTEVTADKYLYTARGVYCSEALAGYSFRLDEWNRLNLEYSHQTINNAYEPDSRLTADTWSLAWAIILPPPPPVRHQTPEEGVTTRKEYLRRKIAYNNEQISRYDTLIAKYDQKILVEGPQDGIQKERDFLLTQRDNLEDDNRKMLELLEK
ncbi:MAG: porin family protein [Candidatus Margulisbacteria bacterium]|jgi:hypothetical protein|nr:porin family protein [Candidatus Margulisiibacteriota bacterium]